MFIRFITFFLTLILLLSGCDNTVISEVKEEGPVKSENVTLEDIHQKLESFIKLDKNNLGQFMISDLKNIKELSQNYFIHYIYKFNEAYYEGIAHVEKVGEKIEILRTEEVMKDNESRVTNLMASGDFNDKSKRYVVTAGTVNDQKIDTILVTYVNQNNVFFKLSSTKRSFLDIQVVENGEQEVGLEQVIGLDSDRKEIYKRNE
ncbi:hypothetical protein C0Q44_00470 [Paenibacillus sp. PCH8]|uniref:hypothetical protein n=1 Tax=Paenibacillus sp. PCH8 TaxID=2066524 RepID=UPI000CF95738|nr:hypothetical protein [Paenibacillus sp. PCH8]PQP83241.1 hypothetical protein C0Q44_00470 [Paenibacillus sp. PCH8]